MKKILMMFVLMMIVVGSVCAIKTNAADEVIATTDGTPERMAIILNDGRRAYCIDPTLKQPWGVVYNAIEKEEMEDWSDLKSLFVGAFLCEQNGYDPLLIQRLMQQAIWMKIGGKATPKYLFNEYGEIAEQIWDEIHAASVDGYIVEITQYGTNETHWHGDEYQRLITATVSVDPKSTEIPEPTPEPVPEEPEKPEEPEPTPEPVLEEPEKPEEPEPEPAKELIPEPIPEPVKEEKYEPIALNEAMVFPKDPEPILPEIIVLEPEPEPTPIVEVAARMQKNDVQRVQTDDKNPIFLYTFFSCFFVFAFIALKKWRK